MNNNFDSVIKGIKVDTANWHTLGQLKQNEKFEVDFYGKTPKIYMGKSAAPGFIKKIKNTAKAVFTYTPTAEEAARGIVRISHGGKIGGVERMVNRTYFGSIATTQETLKWLDSFIDKTLTDMVVLNEKFQEAMPGNLTSMEQTEFLERKMDLFRLMITLRKEVTSSQGLIQNLKGTYEREPEVTKKLQDLEQRLNGEGGLIPFMLNIDLKTVENFPIKLIIEASQMIASPQNIINWLDGFIENRISDLDSLKADYKELLDQGELLEGADEFEKNKMESFRALIALRNEVSTANQFIKELQQTYSDQNDINSKLEALKGKLNADDGLIPALKKYELTLLKNISIDSLVNAGLSVESFEMISESDPINVMTLNERAGIKDAWKLTLKKPDQLIPLPGEPADEVVLAPSILVADISRSYEYRLNHIAYACNQPDNHKENYKEFYLEMNRLLGEEGAKRVGTLLNQTILADSLLIKMAEKGSSTKNYAQIYDLNVENGIVTIEVALTGCFWDLNDPLNLPWLDFFYKLNATFPLAELQAADFNTKEDPLPSMHLTEMVDVSNFTDEQRAFLEGLK